MLAIPAVLRAEAARRTGARPRSSTVHTAATRRPAPKTGDRQGPRRIQEHCAEQRQAGCDCGRFEISAAEISRSLVFSLLPRA